jgi:protocatechuate 3,4-dioxygenase alpha subunit
MSKRGITPSQTVGPFFAFALTPDDYDYPALTSGDLVTADAIGEPIRIEGRVTDGEGKPVPDAFRELWQADGAGRYAGQGDARPNTSFKGFGRSATGKDGSFAFRTEKPGQVAGPNGAMQAPHIDVSLFARGVLRRMFTRIYFAGEPSNASDPILQLVPEERRHTLIARRDGSVDGMPRYVFVVRLQGDDETVFFEA